MAKNVFILGAGASVESGAPLMRNFIDTAEKFLRAGIYHRSDKDYSPHIEEIFDVANQLEQVFIKSHLDLDNIESVFGAIEMANIIKKFGNYPPKRLKQIRESLIILIVKTLELAVQFPIKPGFSCVPYGPESYLTFLEILETALKEDYSIITFNYDVGLDVAFFTNRVNINYCLDPELNRGIKLLKLHGSLNWAFSKKSKRIRPYMFTEFFKKHQWTVADDGDSIVNIELLDSLNELKDIYSDDKINSLPVIVPPTWNKTEYSGQLSNVWHEAANQLEQAENIYAIGYSLPESDYFFRYLYALGTIGKSRIKRFWVYNPDRSAEERYRLLLGRRVLEKSFAFTDWNFSFLRAKLSSVLVT